jgi:pyruvate,water dikinase
MVTSPPLWHEGPGVVRSSTSARLLAIVSEGARVCGRLSSAFLIFLEIIGLRQPYEAVQEAQLARLKLRHTELRKLLSANDSFLVTMAELEAARVEHRPFDTAWVKRMYVRAVADVGRMVDSLDAISGGRHLGLRAAYDRVAAELSAAMEDAGASGAEALVLDLSEIRGVHGDLSGGKMACLGEVRNSVGLPTPDGFVVTTAGYHLVVQGEPALADLADAGGAASATFPTAASIKWREHLLRAPIPDSLAEAILSAYDHLESRLGIRPKMAVRSSALGEDGRRSFAGQFLTVLNVDRSGLIDAYRRVQASLHGPEAAHYRRLHGLGEDTAAMAVGFVAMVEARAAGIVYSREPDRPGSGRVLIQAVHGLGVTLADGGSWAETILVSRDDGGGSLVRGTVSQGTRVVCALDGGTREEDVPEEGSSEACLSDEEARTLAHWALILEAHFGCPQDVEWARDIDRRLWVLQARRLRLASSGDRERRPVANAAVLIQGGETACPGAATGPAVRMDPEGDLETFPAGGILVARRSSPRFGCLMSKAAAIVSDAGSVTGHMASLAREFGVPTLLNLKTATRDIPAGALVTVDAAAGLVYAGAVAVPPAAKPGRLYDTDSGPGLAPTGAHRLLERVVQLLAPLELVDPGSSSFTADRCRTLHDLARFVHESSYAEMFRLGEKLGDMRGCSHVLDAFLPVDIHIIDLGGGIVGPVRGRKVKLSQITSPPLSHLLQGMLDERLPRFGPRPIDLKGLASVMLGHALTSPEEDQTFRDPCYAMVSDAYLNYAARVGYHFSVVDTYCSPTPNRNYITFRFTGGAADRTRRDRRARAVAGILRESGFSVEVKSDLVSARLAKADWEESMRQLEMLGRLLQFFRQMDAAMTKESSVDQLQQAFLRGDLDLTGNAGRGSARQPGRDGNGAPDPSGPQEDEDES